MLYFTKCKKSFFKERQLAFHKTRPAYYAKPIVGLSKRVKQKVFIKLVVLKLTVQINIGIKFLKFHVKNPTLQYYIFFTWFKWKSFNVRFKAF